MEQIINSQEQNGEIIELSATVKQDFIASAKWGKFFSVLGYVSSGIMLLVAIVTLLMPTDLSSMGEEFEDLNISSSLMSMSKGFMFILYLLCAVVCCVIAVFLMKASKNILDGINEQNQDKIAVGVHNLKTFCQIYGIIAIIGLAVTFVSVLGTTLLGISAGI